MAWLYEDVFDGALWPTGNKCVFCGAEMSQLPETRDGVSTHRCAVCGWWRAEESVERDNHSLHLRFYEACGELRQLDLRDVNLPLDEVRRYLSANFEGRHDIDPFLLEDTVAAVFRSCGYHARTTARSHDWGIDVYLDGPGDSLIGIQVKRWRRAISVEQIASLTGSLIINGCTEGIFVTTGRYAKGATEASLKSGEKGVPIKLIDAPRLYDMLRIGLSSPQLDPFDIEMPWNWCELRWHGLSF